MRLTAKVWRRKCPSFPLPLHSGRLSPVLEVGAEAWILVGGAHHTAFSYDLSVDQMVDWAAAMGIESVVIDKDTTIRNFQE